MMYKEKFDWETREDGNTLIRAAAIQNNPERLAKAQEYIEEQKNATASALGLKPTGISRRRRNKATVGSIPIPN